MFLRSIMIVLLAACINAPLLADEEYTQAQINEEIARYIRKEKIGTVVRNVGFGLMGAGAATTLVGGIVLLATAEENTQGVDRLDFLGVTGVGGIVFGGGLISAITGAVIRVVSHKKRIDLESRLSIRYTGNGMAVVFAF